MKKKIEKDYKNFSTDHLEKEIVICKQQQKILKRGKWAATALSVLFAGVGVGIISRSIVNMIDQNEDISILLEVPKQGYILEEVSKLYKEMFSDSNLSHEKEELYYKKIEDLVNLSNKDYINNYANAQLKSEIDEVYSKYHTIDYFYSGLGVTFGGNAITLPLTYVFYKKEWGKCVEESLASKELDIRQSQEMTASIKYSPIAIGEKQIDQ